MDIKGGEDLKINASEIRKLRKEKKLSIRELAELSNVSKSQISDLENKQLLNTTVDTICKLAIALECKPTDLFECD